MIDSTTERVATFALEIRHQDLPAAVRHAAVRAFVNWMGCTLGGSWHPAAKIALSVTREFAGSATATVVGVGREMDPLNSAYINCLASAAHAFDDTHLATVIHPTGPVASALFALAERAPPMSGEDYQRALVVGIEVMCQLGAALLLPPARGQVGWYMTGVAGTIGVAAACSRALGLSHEQTCWALGIAGNQASGFRQTHGSMCTSFVPGHAARCGMHAALLAEKGFTASMASIEGGNGLADVFSIEPNLQYVAENLGREWTTHENAYKPYPSGIVIHPVIDACLALHRRAGFSSSAVGSVRLHVNPMCLTLCDRPAPVGEQDAQVSVQHWAAAALITGRAGLAEGAELLVRDEAVVALRAKVDATPDASMEKDGARVIVTLTDGTVLEEVVEHASGSLLNPMSDQQLSDKFAEQAHTVVSSEQSGALLKQCWALPTLGDVGALAPLTLPDKS